MKPVELSTWDRIVAALAHPVRLGCWCIALGTFVGPIGGASWIVVACIGALLGLIAGELGGKSRVRLPWLLAIPATGALFAGFVRWVLVSRALLPGWIGPSVAVWLSMLTGVFAAALCTVLTLRILARRGPAYEAVELFTLGGLLANAVASHRDGSIARPLWLSDLSWSFGVDPGRVLLVFGAVLTALLASLLLLGADRRKPGPGLLVLPLVALLAWMIATQLPALAPPDPARLFAEAGGEIPANPEDGEDGQGGEAGEGDPDEQGGQNPSDKGKGQQGQPPSTEGDPTDGSQGQGQGQGQGQDPNDGQQGGTPKDPGDDENQAPSKQAPDPMQGGGGSGRTPVAVVLIDDDYVPPSEVWYLRQGELSDFNGSRLIASEVPGSQDDLTSTFAVADEALSYAPPLDHRTEVHGNVSLLVEHPNPFAPEAAVRYAPRANPNPARFDRSYSFVSYALTEPIPGLVGLGVGDPAWSDELRAQYLEAPTDPRYLALAIEVRDAFRTQVPEEKRGDPLIDAIGITLWLGENMSYSKKERHADVADPTADFLFGNRIGYCVHSSHASVYLWRSLGIPSRIATGYAVEESSRRGSVLVVNSGDAHAWSEVYVTGVGWVPLDVAPHENLDETASPPDEDESQMLGEMARQQPDQPPGPRPDYSWIWRPLSILTGSTVTTIALGILVLHWLVKLWRRSRPLWAGSRALSRVGFRAAVDQLTDAGLVRESGETREAFARRLGLPALEELTALHLRGRLGDPNLAHRELSRAQWTGLLTRLRVELASTRPVWRRWLGLLDPTSIYRSR